MYVFFAYLPFSSINSLNPGPVRSPRTRRTASAGRHANADRACVRPLPLDAPPLHPPRRGGLLSPPGRRQHATEKATWSTRDPIVIHCKRFLGGGGKAGRSPCRFQALVWDWGGGQGAVPQDSQKRRTGLQPTNGKRQRRCNKKTGSDGIGGATG